MDMREKHEVTFELVRKAFDEWLSANYEHKVANVNVRKMVAKCNRADRKREDARKRYEKAVDSLYECQNMMLKARAGEDAVDPGVTVDEYEGSVELAAHEVPSSVFMD